MMAMMMKSTKRQPGCQSCPTGLSVRDYTEQPSFKKRRKKKEKVFFEAKSKSLFGYKRDDNALFVQERGVSLRRNILCFVTKIKSPLHIMSVIILVHIVKNIQSPSYNMSVINNSLFDIND